MNVSAPFIRRPVMTTVLTAALVVFGVIAYFNLPVSELPSVDFPTVDVQASLPGADPETMASAVATPLERQFSAIDGVTSMSSESSTGSTDITLQFDFSRNIDSAAQDVQSAISQAMRRLPPDMAGPPTLRKVNPADFSIIYLALTAKHLPLTQLDEYAETRVADRISTVPGVAQVLVFGSHKYAVRLYMNPYALSARNLSLSQVIQAVQAGNTNQPSGALEGSVRAYTVQAPGQLTDAAAFNRLIVAYQDGAPVRLSDVGRAVDSIEDDKQLTMYFNNREDKTPLTPAIVLAVKRQPGANTVQVSRAIRALLPALSAQAPGDARLNLIYDRGDYINSSIHEVKFTLLLAMGLVVGVIFLFLRNVRATAISALALPTSIIGTFAVMHLVHFSLDNLSLMALILAVGFVVDDAIVVLENIVRYREKGEGGMRAALLGSREISFTVVSMTLSLAAVFIPILFMGGLIGRLFREFAATVAIAIILSGIVSLTLTPMLCSRFLNGGGPKGRLFHVLETGFEGMRGVYRRTLVWSVNHWGSMLFVAAAALALTVELFIVIPKGFIPTEDTGQIYAHTQAPEGITFEELKSLQEKVTRIVAANPNVASAMSSAGQGFGGTRASNIGRLFIRLKPMGERTVNADQVLQQLRRATASVHDMQVFFMNPPAIRVGAHAGSGGVDFVLQGPDVKALDWAAAAFAPKLKRLPVVQDVDSDLQLNNPQVNVSILRDVAPAFGVTAQEVQSALYSAFGGRQISSIYGATDEYEVIMQLAPRYQRDINALSALYIHGANGKSVPLQAVASVKPGVGPLSVTHYGQLPSVTFSFNTAPGVSLGEVTNQVQDLARQELPAGITGAFAGNARTFQQSLVDLPVLLGVTVLVIYMVLAILYEHFIHPVTILTALPLAMVGALLTLLAFGQELNIFSFVGLIMLVGLVKKNGIIMIDFALQMRRDRGMAPREAIVEACLVRFRPIMMTTAAAILGILPIALGFGMGAEARRPLGIAVVGGLVVSQLLTLYVTPAFYVAMERLVERWQRRGGRASAESPVEPI